MGKQEDFFAKLTAEAEQTKAGLKEFAGMIFAYYEGLVEAGFSADQALQLTIQYQSVFIAMSLGESNDES
jgi:hypothetical protein